MRFLFSAGVVLDAVTMKISKSAPVGFAVFVCPLVTTREPLDSFQI
jgi:hypothetical protein